MNLLYFAEEFAKRFGWHRAFWIIGVGWLIVWMRRERVWALRR